MDQNLHDIKGSLFLSWVWNSFVSENNCSTSTVSINKAAITSFFFFLIVIEHYMIVSCFARFNRYF